ncbi:MAG: DUF1302 family protein [bacterium]|nr:DUF1302 family protein [bacterium]
MKRWLSLAACLLLAAPAAWAQDGFEDAGFGSGGFGEGFDTEIAAPSIDIGQIDRDFEQKSWDFYGFTKAEAGYSYAKESDQEKFTKMRFTLNLSFDYKFNPDWRLKINGNGFHDQAYRVNGRDQYSQDTLDAYERELELRDTYIEGVLGGGFSLKSGRQIVAWGQSDAAQINDMANPRDNRELGMVDIEDARIPVTATKLTWASGGFQTDLVALHEFRPNKIGTQGSEFDPLSGLRSSGVQVAEDELPANGGEWMFRVLNRYHGGDAALYASETYSDSFYLDFESYSSTAGLTLTPKYAKVRSVGVSANQVFGGMLIKGELARKQGMTYTRNDLAAQIMTLAYSGQMPNQDNVEATVEKTLNQASLGVEYMGITDLTLTLEGIYEQIADYQDNLSSGETTAMTFSSLDYAALNDTLHYRVVWIHFFDQDGDVYRLTVDYDVIDALNISGGLVAFESPSDTALLEPFKNNDRLIAALKYSF